MKILYVITGLSLGGAEKVVITLAEQMYKCGHQVKVVYLTGALVVKPQYEDIDVIYLGLENWRGIYFASKKYRNLLNEYQPDIIHAHMVHANIFARLNKIGGSKSSKLVCSAHNSNEGGKLRMIAYRITDSLSDFNSNVSREATKSFITKGAFLKGKVQTIYNGIDLDKFKKKDNQSILGLKTSLNLLECSRIFISIGRLTKQKDYPNLINAISLLKQEIISKKIIFLIVGDGELKEEIQLLVNNLGLQECVRLLGRRNDISNLLSLADFFVLSSQYEGLPTVLIEAMACESFAIATDCGGSAEIMGETGLLVPPRNSNKLAEAMMKALHLTKNECQINNEKALSRVRKFFSLKESVNKWENIYSELCRK